ncbi:potassium voltage-gated channel subfamily S member 3b [Etheostoma cragini]|uniref:potassium voltage-gated channel subfamily S member 3b n=1 Tax=Etheostoma cragini TaxID=417921 RepID=UPI00155E77CF|nr:potassium voltage-gated channel subfamily S member 3b [Etheostoma cragini]
MGYGQILHRLGKEEDQVHLNVGGVRHKVDPDMLLRFPHTRLARLLRCQSEAAILELCDDYSLSEKEYYFDRNPRVFLCVLNFYHTGCIHMMEEVCVFSFSQEIEYWGIQELHLSPCCSRRKEYIDDREWDVRSDDQQPPSLDSSFEELSALDKDLAKFKGTWCAEVRSYLWLRLEDPGHSRGSKIMAVASLSLVLTSIVAMCVHSMPEFQWVDDNDKPIEDPGLAILEEICIACFSAEFIIRMIVAPSLRKFLQNPLNIIDVASILPFYFTLALETADEEAAEENEDLENMGKVVQVLRLMRILRILKLARHSIGLRALGATIRHSYNEVGLLLLFLSVGISIFSALIYFAEKEEENTDLGTIPSGWWWATITMTTVGYGDTCPVTLAGKIVATLCIVCGLLVVALPVTIIFNKFSKYYQGNKALEGQCITKPQRQDPELPYYNIRDLFTGSVYPFLGGIAYRNSVSSAGDDTDASSLKDIEVYDDTCENRAAKNEIPL